MIKFFTPSLIINALLHMTILFSFLSILFLAYISKILTQLFQNQLNNDTKNAVANSKISITNPVIKQLIQPLKYDNYPDVGMSINNTWVFKILVVCNVFMWLITLLVMGIFKMKFGDDIQLLHITIENIIIFTFVGLFEFVFFLLIASKYAPVSPTEIQQDEINDIQNSLNRK